jgi:hypothetical protein
MGESTAAKIKLNGPAAAKGVGLDSAHPVAVTGDVRLAFPPVPETMHIVNGALPTVAETFVIPPIGAVFGGAAAGPPAPYVRLTTPTGRGAAAAVTVNSGRTLTLNGVGEVACGGALESLAVIIIVTRPVTVGVPLIKQAGLPVCEPLPPGGTVVPVTIKPDTAGALHAIGAVPPLTMT